MCTHEGTDSEETAMFHISERLELQNRLEKLLDLHTRNFSKGYECADGCCTEWPVDECSECQDSWPCETVKILGGK